jgi:salicylate 5-hydroxylase small subunit
MLKDRVYGIKETLFHDPYYQRHVVGTPVVREAGKGAGAARPTTRCSAPSCRMPRPCSTSAATSIPWCARRQGLKFASRECIYDSEMIPNSIIYPI